jgi:chromosome segregation ATPase
MLCISPQGQTTPEKTLSNPWYGKGFCEPQQYKSAIGRCEGGFESLEVGIDVFKRLLKIMESHSTALREWSTASQKQVSESKEGGTNKLAWLNTIRAIEQTLVDKNEIITKGMQKEVVDSMTKYKTEHYGKSFLHVRQIREFEQEFKKVQRPWRDLLDKINAAKQAYHAAKRKLSQAERAAHIIETDVGESEEHQKKAKTSVERRTSDTNTYRTTYEGLIKDMESKRDGYQTQMFEILKRTDDFERNRLKHFNSIYIALKDIILMKTEDKDQAIKKVFDDAIDQQKIEEDIQFFNKNYGRETTTKWPAFEECDE